MNRIVECCKSSSQVENELVVADQPHLHYFDFFGRATPARIAFRFANKTFTDRRFSIQEWPQSKGAFVTGQVPALSIGDQMYFESVPISYYAAENTSLIPRAPLDKLRVESIINLVSNAWALSSKAITGPAEDREQAFSQLINHDYPSTLDILTRIIAENDDRSIVWSTGREMTLADIWLFTWLHFIQFNSFGFSVPSMSTRWPRLNTVYEAVKEHPKTKAAVAEECDSSRQLS